MSKVMIAPALDGALAAPIHRDAPLERAAPLDAIEQVAQSAAEVVVLAEGLSGMLQLAATQPIGARNVERLGDLLSEFERLILDLNALRPKIAAALRA